MSDYRQYITQLESNLQNFYSPTIQELSELIFSTFEYYKTQMPEDHDIENEDIDYFIWNIRSKEKNTQNCLFLNSFTDTYQYLCLLKDVSFGQVARAINCILLDFLGIATLLKHAVLEIELFQIDRVPLIFSDADILKFPLSVLSAYKALRLYTSQAKVFFLPMLRESRIAIEPDEVIKQEVELQKALIKRLVGKSEQALGILLFRSDALACYLDYNFLDTKAEALRKAGDSLKSILEQIDHEMLSKGLALGLLNQEIEKRKSDFNKALDSVLGNSNEKSEKKADDLIEKSKKIGRPQGSSKYTVEVRALIVRLKGQNVPWKNIADKLNRLYPGGKYKDNTLSQWYSENITKLQT